ncbi:EAL domain-containing protein [Calditrichota bacterium]
MISNLLKKIKHDFQTEDQPTLIQQENIDYSDYSFLEQLPMAVAIFDLSGKYKFVNKKYLLDESHKDDIIGKNDDYYFNLIGVSSDGVQRRREYFDRAIKQKEMIGFTEKLFSFHNHKTRYYKRYFQPIFFKNSNEIKEIHLYGSDLTSVMLAQHELEFIVYHDKLTGLNNRDAFNEQIEQLIYEYKDNNQYLFAILFCDIDNFKLANDYYGHDIGDRLLKEAARRLKDVINRSGQLYRLDSDEFTVILKNIKNELEAGRIAEKIINQLSIPYDLRNHKVSNISASIGIVIYPKDGKKKDILIKHGDTALFKAKKSGKNNFQFYSDSITESSVKKLRIESYLRNLVNIDDFENQFDIYYQPIIEKKYSSNYQVIGAEALLRWNNPHMGWIKPDTFIPIAEESDLISNIGDWVLYKAVKDFHELQQRVAMPLYISVNFSAKQMRSISAVKKVETIIKSIGIDPKNLQLELTETNYLEENSDIYKNISALKSLGIKLAIDDFGVGFASLSYLHKIPATTLKIDKSFIRYLSTRKEHKELVKSIIVLGDNLRKDIIAEGVERVEDLYLLDTQKCYKYQGYLFSRPLSIVEFEKYLSKDNLLTTIIRK